MLKTLSSVQHRFGFNNLQSQSDVDVNEVIDLKTQHLKKTPMIWESISRWCVYILTFLTPLFFLPFTTSPVSFNKQVLVIIVTLVGIFSLAIKFLVSGKVNYAKSALNVAVLVLLIISGVSLFFSEAVYQSLGSLYGLHDSYINIVLYGLVFWLFANSLTEFKHILQVVFLFIQSIGILSIFNLLQLHQIFILPWNFTRFINFSPVGGQDYSTQVPNGIMLATGFILIVGLINIISSLPKIARYLCAILGIIMFINLFYLDIGFIWIGLVLAMSIIISFRFWQGNVKHLKEIIVPIVVLVLSLVIIFFGSLITRPDFLYSGSYKDTLYLPRPTALNVVLESFNSVKNVLIGSGPATFSSLYSAHRSIAINDQGNLWASGFNNGYSSALTYLATVGYLGFVAWLFVFIMFGVVVCKLLHKIIKHLSSEEARAIYNYTDCVLLASGVAATFLIFSWFFYPLSFTPTLFLFIFLGLVVSAGSNYLLSTGAQIERVIHLSSTEGSKLKTAGAFLAVILLIFIVSVSAVLIFGTGQRYVAALQAEQASKLLQENKTDQSLEVISKVIAVDSKVDGYHRLTSQILLQKAKLIFADLVKSAEDPKGDKTKQDKLKSDLKLTIENSLIEASLATQINPVSLVNWILVGSIAEDVLLMYANADQVAEQAYKQYSQLAPNNPNGPSGLARVYMAIADRCVNLMELKEAKNDPDSMAKLNKCKDVYLKRGLKSANDSLKLKFDYKEAHALIVNIYQRQGKADLVLSKLKEMALMYPKDASLFYELGLAFSNAKDYASAKEVLRRAIEISPDYSNARYVLGSILSEQDKDKTGALEQFEKILKLNPDNAGIKEIIENLNK